MNWIKEQASTHVGRQPVAIAEKTVQLNGPSTFEIPYSPRVIDQFREGIYQREALNSKALIPLINRLDNAGLYDWVTDTTTATDIIRLARWSFLDDHDDWSIDPNGSCIRAVSFNDIHRRDQGPDFFCLEIGWAYGTKWWELIRHITSRAINYKLFYSKIHEVGESLRDMIDYKGVLNDSLLERMYEQSIGIESPKEIRGNGSLNAEQISSSLRENISNAAAVLEEDWMQAWWPDVMGQLSKEPKMSLYDAMQQGQDSTPILLVHEHLRHLKDIFIRMGRYHTAAKSDQLDLSETMSMHDESEMDQYMNWIWWNNDSECLDTAMTQSWDAMSHFNIIVGGQMRQIKKGEILETCNDHLYGVRRNLQSELCQWLLELYQYLHPKK